MKGTPAPDDDTPCRQPTHSQRPLPVALSPAYEKLIQLWQNARLPAVSRGAAPLLPVDRNDGVSSELRRDRNNESGGRSRWAMVLCTLLLAMSGVWKGMGLKPSDAMADMANSHPSTLRSLQAAPAACPPTEASSSFAWVSEIPAAAQYTLITILILFSAFFSGLTLSMMGLDVIGLEIVMSGDDVKLSRAAGKILPVRKKSNLLLCTLLLGNVAVNTLLGILMADITNGLVGFLTSTGLIVIFGEIIPQAFFSRHALMVGERAVPMVKVIIFLLYILAKPLAYCLDRLLGHELGTTYSKAEMNKLLEIHVKEGRFNQETGNAMAGALKYQDVMVKDVMTPLENTFMIDVEDKLNFDTMSKIFKTGYSRIPIFESSVQNVIGLLFTKDLIFIDPDDETPVRNFVQIFGRGFHIVWHDDKLGEVLRYLKKGHTHMALVRSTNNSKSPDLDPIYVLEGIVTLEDIIEEIIGEEILDETDAWVDGEHSQKVNRDAGFNWASLRMLDAKIVDQTLSEEEVKAVAAHLRTNHWETVTDLSDRQLPRMIAATPVVELPVSPSREIGQLLPSSNLLYEKNLPSDVCTLLLGGKVTVVAGTDNFKSDVSSWTLLGAGALQNQNYTPDFSAYVSGSGPCRCLRFTRTIFEAAVKASTLEGAPKADNNDDAKPSRADVNGNHVVVNPPRAASNPSPAQPFTQFDPMANQFTATPISIHDELRDGENDASTDVRGRRSKLLDVLLEEKTNANAPNDDDSSYTIGNIRPNRNDAK